MFRLRHGLRGCSVGDSSVGDRSVGDCSGVRRFGITRGLAITLVGIAGLGSAQSVDASLIASHKGTAAQSADSPFPRAFGQAFTTPSGTGWNNITVNFFSDAASTTPQAYGDLYLLTSPYGSSPSGLSSSVAGFVAEAPAVSNQFVFDPSVSLSPATQYYVYEDTLTPSDDVYADTNAPGQSLFTARAPAPAS